MRILAIRGELLHYEEFVNGWVARVHHSKVVVDAEYIVYFSEKVVNLLK